MQPTKSWTALAVANLLQEEVYFVFDEFDDILPGVVLMD